MRPLLSVVLDLLRRNLDRQINRESALASALFDHAILSSDLGQISSLAQHHITIIVPLPHQGGFTGEDIVVQRGCSGRARFSHQLDLGSVHHRHGTLLCCVIYELVCTQLLNRGGEEET